MLGDEGIIAKLLFESYLQVVDLLVAAVCQSEMSIRFSGKQKKILLFLPIGERTA